ncbi:hypothetical protein LR48_Vigan02g052700 [Vigna angularis]|uniref:Uncharacterized protein n=1 Tax=Phaseolus angularis TaxID=3914 RepID=A0A0L9TVD4_PHAAN|nr:hypothetical protein LR48_Vigan02g052700 [Vigna angularis]
MSNPTLIGPPELYIAEPTATLAQTIPDPASIPTVTCTTPSDPFMNLMVSAFNTTSTPNMTLMENLSPTFLTTGNPCLDFFFHVVPDTPPATFLQRLKLVVFPREEYNEYEGVEEAHYAYRVRDRLRKEVLVPLRKVLELPEVFIGDNRWDLIPYNRVASVAMEFYKDKFLKHDKERFKAYLKDVESGKSTIVVGASLPHRIIRSLDNGDCEDVTELQWKRVVDDLKKKGMMKSCLVVCDVSGIWKKGFGDVVPQMIFWNLRDSKATPMPGTQKAVALPCGFSKNLLALLLDKEGAKLRRILHFSTLFLYVAFSVFYNAVFGQTFSRRRRGVRQTPQRRFLV